ILRCWSAKLFELQELFNLKNSRNRTSDKVLVHLAKIAKETFAKMTKDGGLNIARIIRNEATSHYYLRPAVKNLDSLSEDANLSFFMHEMEGNSFYPVGEELMFFARLNKLGENFETKEQKLSIFDDWMEWNLHATEWAVSIKDLYSNQIILKRFPNKCAVRRDYWINPALVGTKEDRKTPVFYRKAKA
ncbi:MAG: hypothetical protein WBB25_03235, partial [Sulfitobacter sp.]